MTKRVTPWLAIFFFVSVSATANDSFDIVPFLDAHCLECHDADTAKGDVILEGMKSDFTDNALAGLWNRVMDQVAFGEMPPKKKTRPDTEEKEAVIAWIEKELVEAGHSPDLREKMNAPEYGNYVDHETLFDGSVKSPAYSPARLWKRSPQIYDSMINRGVGVSGPGRYGQRPSHLAKVKQPFTIEDRAGINDYAALTMADSATLSTMMRNAELIVDKLTGQAFHEVYVKEHGEVPVDELPKDKKGNPIRPKFAKTPEEFRSVILGQSPPADAQLDDAVTKMFALVIEQEPGAEDLAKYRQLIRSCIEEGGAAEALRTGLIAIAISPEAIYRSELGQGPPDEYGRQLLGPAELAYAISYSLTDDKPDQIMLEAVRSGKLKTRNDVEREVLRIWDDTEIEKPRILRFFHEFFGYQNAPKVFKDAARFEGDFRRVPGMLVKDADVLVMHIVNRDRDVLSELLTTEKYFVMHSGDNETERVTHDALQQFYDYYKDKPWRDFEYKIDPEHMKVVRPIHRMFTHANGNVTKRWMTYLTFCDENGLSHLPMANGHNYLAAYNLSYKTFSFPVEQPFTLDAGKRIGILMHPAWLLAHSLNLDNDPVRRGKWIQERLLAGTVPELPITVDASIPEDPHRSLRERFTKISEDGYCWRCHERMNPLGMPFETFDDFGRHRRGVELLHAKGESKPVDASGMLVGASPELDGEVGDPVELLRRIARSDRARQSFVRHAFRYWMGRNETLGDSATLIAADKAYSENGGSFRALVISLLTSDSFLYRKSPAES